MLDTSKPIRPEDIVAASDADIASMNTRHILALYQKWCPHDWDNGVSYGVPLTPWEKMVREAVIRLGKELDKRPHVPNKKEAKELRRQAAKAKR